MIPNYNPQFNPQYFQQQFDQAMNQYKNIYNQASTYNTNNANGFIGQYVNSYDEVEKAQVPMNGTPTMFVGDGVFWIKKFVNGQPYISAYKFEGINNVGQPVEQQNNQSNNDNDIAVILQALEKSVNNLNDRLEKIERRTQNGVREQSNSQYDGKQNQTNKSSNG